MCKVQCLKLAWTTWTLLLGPWAYRLQLIPPCSTYLRLALPSALKAICLSKSRALYCVLNQPAINKIRQTGDSSSTKTMVFKQYPVVHLMTAILDHLPPKAKQTLHRRATVKSPTKLFVPLWKLTFRNTCWLCLTLLSSFQSTQTEVHEAHWPRSK